MRKPLLTTDFLDRARRHYADEEAVLATDGTRYTYAELGERADRFSAVLQECGIEKGDRVAVLDPNTHYHLEAAYGAMQIGAVHTPLNYRLTPDDFSYMLSDAGVDAIYADAEYAANVEAIREEVPTETFLTNDADAIEGDWESFDEALADANPDAYERPEMDEDDVITINYTSGTTGDPKGVCRTHRAETLHAYLITIHQEITDDDVYLWTLPMFHVNGWGHIYAITGMGARHICTRGVDVEAVFDRIRARTCRTSVRRRPCSTCSATTTPTTAARRPATTTCGQPPRARRRRRQRSAPLRKSSAGISNTCTARPRRGRS